MSMPTQKRNLSKRYYSLAMQKYATWNINAESKVDHTSFVCLQPNPTNSLTKQCVWNPQMSRHTCTGSLKYRCCAGLYLDRWLKMADRCIAKRHMTCACQFSFNGFCYCSLCSSMQATLLKDRQEWNIKSPAKGQALQKFQFHPGANKLTFYYFIQI